MNTKPLISCLAILVLASFSPMSSEAASSIQQQVSQIRTIKGHIDPEAKYYAYLQSASWCGPCQQEMPKIAKQYQAMKAAGMEVILCSHDVSAQKAIAFMKKHGAEFPAVMAKEAGSLPGFEQASGIPNAIVVDSDGRVLKKGHGSILENWQDIINNPTTQKEGQSCSQGTACGQNGGCPAAGQTEDTVAEALQKASFFNANPDKDAAYYIYFYASSSCCGCRMVMPRVASLYPEMKSHGVELIHFSCDQTRREAEQCLKSNQATFPATMASGNEAYFPGHPTGVIPLPYAVIVDTEGSVIYKDNAAFLENWKSFLPAGGAGGQ